MKTPRPGLGLSLPGAATSPTACPCGSGGELAACCGRVHADQRSAQTAEALMRARYSAFALRRREFLSQSWHPSTRPRSIDLDDSAEWVGLIIDSVNAGDATDSTGIVAFTARYLDSTLPPSDNERRLIERSQFVREDGCWYYLDGEA